MKPNKLIAGKKFQLRMSTLSPKNGKPTIITKWVGTPEEAAIVWSTHKAYDASVKYQHTAHALQFSDLGYPETRMWAYFQKKFKKRVLPIFEKLFNS